MNTIQSYDRTPAHLWVVGVVSLIWNLGGGMDYLMTQIRNETYLQTAADTVGMELAEVVSYFDAFPLWMDISWALGVWGAVAGSILLLLRNRFAMHAFIVSLLGIVVSTYYQFANPFAGPVDSVIPTVMAVLVPLLTLLLIWYARRQTAKGVLR